MAWRKAHPAEKKAYDKAWREEHATERKAYNQANYLKHRSRYLAHSRAYSAGLTPEQRLERRLRSAYGFSLAQYREFMGINGGLCCWPGCSCPATDVDHDHETGEIRRPLCGHHNRLEGVFAKNVHELANWERYKQMPPFKLGDQNALVHRPFWVRGADRKPVQSVQLRLVG